MHRVRWRGWLLAALLAVAGCDDDGGGGGAGGAGGADGAAGEGGGGAGGDGGGGAGGEAPCVDGAEQPCTVGGCEGTARCVDGAFGDCEGPAETCDGADNDCDGESDEDFAGLGDACSAGVGACAADGTQVCNAAGDGIECNAVAGTPEAEACDGADNDCNGTTDDGLVPEPCYDGPAGTEGQGVCVGGTRTCADGALGACEGQVQPGEEVCDGADNDCNGTDDDVAGLGDACTAGVGACAADGVQVCGDGGLECDAVPGAPADETCDEVDNDCNGTVDDVAGLGDACSAGVGACARDGVLVCSPDGVVCDAVPGDPVDEACDGTDNDCDGNTDEDTERDCYDGPDGTAGVGLCRTGRQACVAGAYGACDGQVLPVDEICNEQDDDCNGQDDNGLDCSECGNGVVEPGEDCDDGNLLPRDTCTADCQFEAALPIAAPGESILIAGNLGADDPRWARPTPGCQHEPGADHPYEAFRVVNNTGAEQALTIAARWPGGDGYLHVFEDGFDPRVLDGCVIGNDDFNGTSASLLNNVVIPAGGVLVIVASTYNGGINIGDYTLTILTQAGAGPECGNGVPEMGEECDDGNNDAGDGCSADCRNEPPGCGNGRLEPGEECDDGNLVPGDDCSPLCTIEPRCGNGRLEPGERCDDGNNDPGDGCTPDCQLEPGCGNGQLDPGEACDDGNRNAGEGCDAGCRLEPAQPIADPGNSLRIMGSIAMGDSQWVRPNADCSPGFGLPNERFFYDAWRIVNQTGQAQRLTLDASWLADGYLHVLRDPPLDVGRCVIGNDDFNGIRASHLENVVIAPGEVLVVVASTFSPNTAIGDYTLTILTAGPVVCGNGVLEAGEACDDGNLDAGDGCDGNCEIEVEQPALDFAGVRANLSEDVARNGGFEVCYQDVYADDLDTAAIQANCDADVLMVACRPVGADAFTLAAMGLRDEVLLPVPNELNAGHDHNGVRWYYGEDFSFGFAPAGAELQRSECDTAAGDDRLCWHTVGEFGGYRCGDAQGLNEDGMWERVILQRPGSVGGVPLGANVGFGAHGSCDTFNICNDAATCANAACAFYGQGSAVSWQEGRCTDLAALPGGMDCNLFNVLPSPAEPGILDENWPNGCNIPVAYDVRCSDAAVPAVCGDGVLADGEACDDGNQVDGDGCSAQCTVERPLPPDAVAGVQLNVAQAAVEGRGFQACYAGTYAESVPLAEVLADCGGDQLMLACRRLGQPNFAVAAEGNREAVLRDVGNGPNAFHAHNGVGWYYSPTFSMGFGPVAGPFARNSCDTEASFGGQRLCWHTNADNLEGGWRCGEATGLNADAMWERVILTRSTVALAGVVTLCDEGWPMVEHGGICGVPGDPATSYAFDFDTATKVPVGDPTADLVKGHVNGDCCNFNPLNGATQVDTGVAAADFDAVDCGPDDGRMYGAGQIPFGQPFERVVCLRTAAGRYVKYRAESACCGDINLPWQATR